MTSGTRYHMPLWGVITKEALVEIARSPRWELALSSVALLAKPSPQEAANVAFFLRELVESPSVTGARLRAVTGLVLGLSFKYPFAHLDDLAAKLLSDMPDDDHPRGSYNIHPANFVKVANKLCNMQRYEAIVAMYLSLQKSEKLNNSFEDYSFPHDARIASTALTEDVISLLQQREHAELEKFFKETLSNSVKQGVYLPIPLPLFDETSWGAATQDEVLHTMNHWYKAMNSDAKEMSLKQALMADTELSDHFLQGKQSLIHQIKNRNLKGARRKSLEHIAQGQPITMSKIGERWSYDVLTDNMIHYQGAAFTSMLYPWGDSLADTLVGAFLRRGGLCDIWCPLAEDRKFLGLLEEKIANTDLLEKAHKQGLKSSSQWVKHIRRMFDRVYFMDEPVLEKCFARAWEKAAFKEVDIECITARESLLGPEWGIAVIPVALPGATIKKLHEYNVQHGTNLGNIKNVCYLEAETREDVELANQLTTDTNNPLTSLYVAARGPIFSNEEISKALSGEEVKVGNNIVSPDEVIDTAAKYGADLGLSQTSPLFWSIFLDLAPHYCARDRQDWIETAAAAAA